MMTSAGDTMKRFLIAAIALCLLSSTAVSQGANSATNKIDLPNSKQLLKPAPGEPIPLNAFPGVIALSPDGNFAAVLNNGRGTGPSHLRQSIAIYEFSTGKLTDFPDARFKLDAKQTYFFGLAFNSRGDEVYASVQSLTDPTGKTEGDLGNGIAVYSFRDGKLAPARFLKIPAQPVTPGKIVARAEKAGEKGTAIPGPAGIAVVKGEGGAERLLVANNLSDNVVLLDAQTGAVEAAFDLSAGNYIPTVMPYAAIVSRDGKRAWVSMWNTATVAELDLAANRVVRRIALEPVRETKVMAHSSAHATALALSPDGKRLFVTLSNRDAVAVVDTAKGSLLGSIPTALPMQKLGTSIPIAVAASATRLYIASAQLDAVQVVNIAEWKSVADAKVLGFIPTEYYPSALALRGDDLLVATAKGEGTGTNNIPPFKEDNRKPWAYIGDLVAGSLARINVRSIENQLPALTAQVVASNRMDKVPAKMDFSASGHKASPIKHVIYVIKENRTYDQVLGDLGAGNGDKGLAMYGSDVTPNHHKLALQFGVLDNFYDSGEISGNGHVWSNAAISSDYTEKIWPINYRGRERTYDFEGMVLDETPYERGIPDVNEPATGYTWAHAARHGLTHRNYGEFVHTRWCQDEEEAAPLNPSELLGPCKLKMIKKGEPIPASLAAFDPLGAKSPYPWDIPVYASSRGVKPEIVGNLDPDYPNFRLEWPDQWRADEFLRELSGFVEARKRGDAKHEMPSLIVMQLPNDHTSGTKAEKPTPAAQVADNDLALGRIVEAVSNSPYWDDTAILVLEDDAQDGPDHVDAHRSLALVISKYAPRRAGKPFVESGFFTTVNMIRTLEDLLGLPPMNLNDAFAPPIASLFGGVGDQPAFKADHGNAENGLIFKTNPKRNPDAKRSAAMDFSQPDHADPSALNAILWRDRMGNKPMPAPKHTVIPEKAGSGEKD
jgi:DNA-binding beta-propeller fold protein YncE